MDRLRVMKTFVRDVETGSFSAAARHLNVNQPAVSKSIARLEEQLGVVRTVEEGQRYRKDFNERLRRNGRAPGDLKVLPGILPIVARSRSEAQEKRDFLETLVPERVGIDLVSSWCRRGFVGLSNRPTTPAVAPRASHG